MNAFADKIFKGRAVIFDKLLNYGFENKNGRYAYKTLICDKQMELTVIIEESGNVNTQVYDLASQDEYTLFLVENAAGNFVGRVRADYAAALKDIAEKCFEKCVFKEEYSKRIIEYVRERYSDELEYLWDKFPQNAICRRKDNKKWYAVVLTVSKKKLGFNSEEIAEILDLRVDPEKIESIVDNKKYFYGYHMNKKHWITVCLDGSVDLEEIFSRIDDSYILAKK